MNIQQKRERRNLRSKHKRTFLNLGGTRTTARFMAPFATGEYRVMLRRIARGTMARNSLKAGAK